MIDGEQRKKLKAVLGYHYTSSVLKILKEYKVTNRRGKPYGTSMIRNVFNGLNKNEKIENAILELFYQTIEKNERREALMNELLNINDT
ncbi:hypothetical protein [Kordia jejudonensis]|uniref:hypothetical protein n=1 Tax=Kordia jejudonensis TaxID=1348245 RepID=UPI00062983A3|nr:hypothetical protein [Kordia jejudonensis]